MTAGKETMGEQPIFTCKAHVFHIDPKTKRSWMSASTTAVSVSFFYDSSRDLYRIISVEGSKAVINSTITGNMTFTKTSQKFGQWSDVRANTVYGLGFASEQELGKFIEKFQEVKEAIQARGGGADKLNNGSSAVTPVASAAASPLLVARAAADDPPIPQIKQENDDMPGHQRAHSISSSVQGGYATVGRSPRAPSTTVVAPPDPISGDTEMQLRYENDRLKLALAQSSANAKKWEVELATLKSNNLRLTAALQESTANVDEWKRQLHQYREEVARARNMQGKGGEASEVEQLRVRVSQLEAELSHKDEELAQLNKSRRSEQDAEAKLAQSQLELALAAHDGQRQVVQALNDQLSRQIEELTNIHREINTALQT